MATNRSEATKAWLRLQREAHSEASAQDRSTGIMGSMYGSDWGYSGVPTASQEVADHVVAQEHFQPKRRLDPGKSQRHPKPGQLGNLLNLPKLGERRQPTGTFLDDRRPAHLGRVHAVGRLDPKKRLLARKVAYTTLSYLGISNKRTSKGNSSLQTSSGIGVYRLAWTTGSFPQLVVGPVDPWERRMALLTLAVEEWQVGNPLVLYPSLLDEDLKALLSARFNGSNALLKLCDEALQASVLAAPR